MIYLHVWHHDLDLQNLSPDKSMIIFFWQSKSNTLHPCRIPFVFRIWLGPREHYDVLEHGPQNDILLTSGPQITVIFSFTYMVQSLFLIDHRLLIHHSIANQGSALSKVDSGFILIYFKPNCNGRYVEAGLLESARDGPSPGTWRLSRCGVAVPYICMGEFWNPWSQANPAIWKWTPVWLRCQS